jgi:NADH-quinone oxidoreductase subunit M
MTGAIPAWLAPAWLFGVTLSTVWTGQQRMRAIARAVSIAPQRDRVVSAAVNASNVPALLLGLNLAVLLVALLASDGRLAYAAVAASGFLTSWSAWRVSRTGALYVAVAAVLSGVAAIGSVMPGSPAVLVPSLLAIALRTGVFPLHAGVAALSESESSRQLEQLAALPVLVFVHLRFADHGALAHDLAPVLVGIGGATTLLFALTALVQRELRQLYVASTLMHGGMVFAAVGAAGRGHYAAALLVVVTMVLALAGFSAMLAAFEARVGRGPHADFAGRARAFPRLAAALFFFGGAAVGLPGTAGFVADDLLLHALWEESVWTAVTVIVASALLAVATLATFARVFLGPPQRYLAPDLLPRERRAAVVLMLLLVILGFVPALLVSPVNALLQ